MNLFSKLLALLLASSCPLSAAASSRDAQWKKVQEAINQGLPKTAITNLEPIIQGALKDKAYDEAVRALAQKIALEGNIQGNKPEEKITRLEAAIATSPKEMVPMLDTILAHWYWQYFQQNRWRFLQRTTTSQPPGKDFTTWDLPRLLAAIDQQFQKALAAQPVLKTIPVAAWNDLLQKGTMSDAYRPTLYDFIGYEALQFYTAGEQAAAQAEDAFELTADSPAFDSAEKFIAWNPPTPASEQGAVGPPSPVLRALHLYQDLLRFHAPDPAPRLAFAHADLERLTWAWNTASGETKNTRYKSALEQFIQTYGDFEISALALEREGRVFQQEGDLVKAHELAQRGHGIFPNSLPGKLCFNLVTEIESESVTITTERVWNCQNRSADASTNDTSAPCPEITIHYRNIDAAYFRAIRYDWAQFLQTRSSGPGNLSQQECRALLAKSPTLEWSEKLPPTQDYQERTFKAPAPRNLKPGFYFIFSSQSPQFNEKQNQVSFTSVWVSDLALITRTRNDRLEGFVLQANSGEPLAGAEVAVWRRDANGNRISEPNLTTDENGFFSLQPQENRGYLLRARYQGQEVATIGDVWTYGYRTFNPQELPGAQTVFFTDRVLYRPGQTIQYKGICLWVDQAKDNYEPLKNEQLTVVFRDSNGKEIARQRQRANDYGSFSGSFVAPRDRVMGQMVLQVDGRAQGNTTVRVEEYKRPKFEVTLEAPKTATRLNDKVTLTGHATSYTGAAVDGALVKYHVIREVRMPWWWGWWGRGAHFGSSQDIAHGTARTETDGLFHIEFTARPDPKVPEADEPTFVFNINADVTDSAGETRSAQHSIRVGYTALEATLTADDWQTTNKPVALTVETRTLDGEPQVAEGSIKIYTLQQPEKVQRSSLDNQPYTRFSAPGVAGEQEQADQSDPNSWALGKLVAERGFNTDTNGHAELSFELPAGAYRAMLETQDRFGKKVTGKLPLQVLNPDDTRLAIKIPHLLTARAWELQPGQEFLAVWGTGYDTGRAFIEIEHRHQVLQRYWTRPGQTQQAIRLAVTEAMRGGFTLHVTQVRENRAYLDSRRVDVPWRNKQLLLSWEHFVSKLQPGQHETWSLVVKPRTYTRSASANSPNTEFSLAELVATLYDESLDAFAPHNWLQGFGIFRQDYSSIQAQQFVNGSEQFQYCLGTWRREFVPVVITYRSLPADLTMNLVGYQYFRARNGAVGGLGGGLAGGALEAPRSFSLGRESVNDLALYAAPAAKAELLADKRPEDAAVPNSQPKPNLGQVTLRKNLNETAFFFPQLTSDSNGVVRMTFTMPEALTKWRFMGFAHDQQLRSGYLEGHAVTSKDLMVQPNPPRFLREGDTVEFTVKVSNQSSQPQTGLVRLTFENAFQAESEAPGQQRPPRADNLLGNTKPEQPFTIPAKQSRSFSWRITVPDGCGFLTYKAVAAAAQVSDGEEGPLPVLSRRILVIESLPLPIRGPATKKFEFTRLLKSGASKTLQNQSLTLQMVSHPAWYAVLALPYLMEYPYECSEQTFNRLYANALARSIANSDPKIHGIFEQWKNTPALESPLEKNQDLKSVALEETPWLRQAQSESQARKNVGILFDDNRLEYETQRTLQKLTDLQLADGSWPWFPGGPGNDYITLYITTGFGRLRHLGVDVPIQPAIRSLARLDAWMTDNYERIQKWPEPWNYVPTPTDALYLYGRSFFLKDQPVAPANQKAIQFFLTQSRKFWLKTDCRQTQGQLALALQRFKQAGGFDLDDTTPTAIMKSLKERSVSNEELGMFWRDTELSWWWYRAPIETQALMIEAFDEVAHDNQAVEECKVWMLKQKQTQDWKTTKATADAVYALLLRGKELLSSDALVEVKLGGQDVTPKPGPIEIRNSKTGTPIEPGTGFYEVRFTPSEIRPKLGGITLRKSDPGVAWGSLNWQYLEDMTKVTSYEGTPLKLKKTLFIKSNTARGQVLSPVKGPLSVGDELVVRIELRVDRDMEYIHLKDQRGSGTEPVNVLSRYKYQDGLAYYESTRDTASHFFIDYLPKGTYVFEYSTRVQLRGQYQTGIAEIQCMYAPEFNSHSQSFKLVVQ